MPALNEMSLKDLRELFELRLDTPVGTVLEFFGPEEAIAWAQQAAADGRLQLLGANDSVIICIVPMLAGRLADPDAFSASVLTEVLRSPALGLLLNPCAAANAKSLDALLRLWHFSLISRMALKAPTTRMSRTQWAPPTRGTPVPLVHSPGPLQRLIARFANQPAAEAGRQFSPLILGTAFAGMLVLGLTGHLLLGGRNGADTVRLPVPHNSAPAPSAEPNYSPPPEPMPGLGSDSSVEGSTP